MSLSGDMRGFDMAAAQKHRQAIIDAAVDLFRRQGYSGTGLNDVVRASGAPKGSLYHYFPHGKASIAEAAVLEAGTRVADTVRELSGKAASTGDLVKSHAQLLAGWMTKSEWKDGSPVTTVILEMAPENDAVTEAGRQVFAAWRQVIQNHLVTDGFDDLRAERLAFLCTAVIEGALVQSRVEKSGQPLLTASEELAQLLAAAAKQQPFTLPPTAGSPG